MSAALSVGIVGCGLIGRKRAEAMADDKVVGCVDIVPAAAEALARDTGAEVLPTFEALLEMRPDIVIVATTHDRLAPLAIRALESGAHVLVEKPAGISSADVERVAAAASRVGKLVKVGFNHRFHAGIARAVEEARSGRYGEVMFVRGRYGHGGRVGYDREWRADPVHSGGGELIDQGMHLLDLSHWLLGPLPLHSALLRTQFWDAPVEDNAALLLGEAERRDAPWATLHVTWTEWKNLFSLEIYCRTAKLHVDGLVRSYGPQTLRIYRMRPELGPPDVEEVVSDGVDRSWEREWRNFADAIRGGDDSTLLGTLDDAHYAWTVVEDAYRRSGWTAEMREPVGR